MFDGVKPAAPRRRRSVDARKLLPVARQDDDRVGQAIALRLLGSPSEDEIGIDRLLSYAPTPAQIEAGRDAIAEWLLTDPEMDGVVAALGGLLRACRTDRIKLVELAAERVRGALADAVRRGFDPDCLAAILRYWSAITPDAPHVTTAITKGA